MQRRKVDTLCVQKTNWKGCKARRIGSGLKLFYHAVDGIKNGVEVSQECYGSEKSIRRGDDWKKV